MCCQCITRAVAGYDYSVTWPTSFARLSRLQVSLAGDLPGGQQTFTGDESVGGVFVCFGRGGHGSGLVDEAGWAGAAVVQDGHIDAGVAIGGRAGGPYRSGYLAVREGPLLEAVMRALGELPGVLIVNATGLDHPRRAGLAIHLGKVLGVPTVGVTHRPLLATGDWPQSNEMGATSELVLREEVVGGWVRTQPGCRPLAVHSGWRTSPDTARLVVLSSTWISRTPEPLREARRLARTARTDAGHRPDRAPPVGPEHRRKR
jgi:deoxyribonuclease V